MAYVSNRNNQKTEYFTKIIFLDAKTLILKFFEVVAQHTFKQYDYMEILN